MDKVSYENIGMFAAIPHSFIKESKKLKFHSRWLYVALVYYRNSKNGKSFPSYDTIQQSTGLRREMIAKCLNELEESGWIKPRKKRYGNSNVYEVVLNKEAKKFKKNRLLKL